MSAFENFPPTAEDVCAERHGETYPYPCAECRELAIEWRQDAAQVWDEGHRAECIYFPDCVELGHHDPNPYRATTDGVDA